MRQNRAAFRELDIYFAVRSWVDCIINMSGFDLRQTQETGMDGATIFGRFADSHIRGG